MSSPTSGTGGLSLGIIIAIAVAGAVLLLIFVVIGKFYHSSLWSSNVSTVIILVKSYQRKGDARYTPLLESQNRVNAYEPSSSTSSYQPAPGVSSPPVVAGERRFRLIADIRDTGEGVLTGEKMGTMGIVTEEELEGGQDWVWVSVEGGKRGWCPRNHMTLL